jgi:hypothetical protein
MHSFCALAAAATMLFAVAYMLSIAVSHVVGFDYIAGVLGWFTPIVFVTIVGSWVIGLLAVGAREWYDIIVDAVSHFRGPTKRSTLWCGVTNTIG